MMDLTKNLPEKLLEIRRTKDLFLYLVVASGELIRKFYLPIIDNGLIYEYQERGYYVVIY